MKREFLGTGWRFPVGTDESGGIERSAGERDVAEAIRVILGTAKGERVMRPEFGCGIHDHVFAAITATTLALVETDVEEALVEWEPRIDVLRVEATPDDRKRGRLTVGIDYRIRASNAEFNLVYPFYLEES